MKTLTFGLVTASLALFLTGCTGGASNTEGTSSAPSTSTNAATNPAKSDLKVAMVFDSGGIGDKSFNDSANAGLTKAEQESEKLWAVGDEAITKGTQELRPITVEQMDNCHHTRH